MKQRMCARERVGDVAVVTLDDGGQNRISGPSCAAIRGELAALAADEAVRAVVLTGGEKFFCNGLDLDWMKTQGKRELFGFLMDVSALLKDTALFPKPLIGAISGHAFGLGAIWSSGFDFRLVRKDRGWICYPEMDIDIPFSPGMIAICEHGLGTRLFREMAWSAKRYSGEEAAAAGWARGALDGGEALREAALELAGFMAKKGVNAFRLTKQTWARGVVEVIDTRDAAAYAKIPLRF
ncbi:MAG: enoyl-CoA hydratase/isomerase family protein [Pseudomonadota bacterium]